jgi:hypothetical protein
MKVRDWLASWPQGSDSLAVATRALMHIAVMACWGEVLNEPRGDCQCYSCTARDALGQMGIEVPDDIEAER